MILGRAKAYSKMRLTTRLSYLAVQKFWIVVGALRSRSEIDGNWFVRFADTVPGILGLVSFGFGTDWGPKSAISGRILKSFPGPFSSAETTLRCDFWGL